MIIGKEVEDLKHDYRDQYGRLELVAVTTITTAAGCSYLLPFFCIHWKSPVDQLLDDHTLVFQRLLSPDAC